MCVMIVVVCYLLMAPTIILSFCNWMQFRRDFQFRGEWNAPLDTGPGKRGKTVIVS